MACSPPTTLPSLCYELSLVDRSKASDESSAHLTTAARLNQTHRRHALCRLDSCMAEDDWNRQTNINFILTVTLTSCCANKTISLIAHDRQTCNVMEFLMCGPRLIWLTKSHTNVHPSIVDRTRMVEYEYKRTDKRTFVNHRTVRI